MRNQAGTRGGRLLQARRFRVQSKVQCLGTFYLVLCARDLFLALFELEGRLLQLRLQLRDFQNCQCLSLVHNVANVHIDLLHVAAHLGVYVDHLIRLELPGQRKHMGDVAALRRRYTCRGRGSSLSLGVGAT